MMELIFNLAQSSGAASEPELTGAIWPQMLLLLSIVAPLCGAFALAISGKLPDSAVKLTALVSFLLPALTGVLLSVAYVQGDYAGGYAFQLMVPSGLEAWGINLILGLNGISLPLYAMAGLVGLAAGLYAMHAGYERLRLFLILLLTMQGGLMGLFASMDLFFFYFFHEFALIPTFILIAIWGRLGRKVVALEMTVYLTVGAMLTLVGLIALVYFSGVETYSFAALHLALAEAPHSGVIFGLLLFGFGILVSLFPFHSWAPSGYATAPAPAAMLHAGVLKKFGLYGLLQIAAPLLPTGFADWSGVLLWLALGNIVIIGLVAMSELDLKRMLGNASVMHMGYAFLGIYAYSVVGVGGTVMMMLAHGLSVALLFLLADSVERRTGTTLFREMGGLAQTAPVLMAFFVAGIMASIGLPGFANFWGELAIFVSLQDSPAPWALPVALLGIVISAIYGLSAVARVFFGPAKAAPASPPVLNGDLRWGEKLPAGLLVLALLVVGFWPRAYSEGVDAAVAELYPEVAPHAVIRESAATVVAEEVSE